MHPSIQNVLFAQTKTIPSEEEPAVPAKDTAGPDGEGGQGNTEGQKGVGGEERGGDVEVCIAGNRGVQRRKWLHYSDPIWFACVVVLTHILSFIPFSARSPQLALMQFSSSIGIPLRKR